MSSHEVLSAASNDRKARLAQLKSLKRKQAPTDTPDHDHDSSSSAHAEPASSTALTNPSVTQTYLSGRNFDPATRNVKLGFDSAPISDPTSTLEYKAEQLALETRTLQETEQAEDKGLDLFKLQPKRPNWDLKRDLREKMRGLDGQTENAIARMVRERIERQKLKQVEARNGNGGGGEEVGMKGEELVEAMHLKEVEEERERVREREDDDAEGDVS
jgi:coiled-coil domain-containing protein 12